MVFYIYYRSFEKMCFFDAFISYNLSLIEGVFKSAFLLVRLFNQIPFNNQSRSCPPPLYPTPPHRAPPPLLPTPPFRGPPPLLPTPPLPPGAWSGFRTREYPPPPPNFALMPRYTFGEEPRGNRRRKKHRTSNRNTTNSPYA